MLKPTDYQISTEAAWVWQNRSLPASAVPLLTPRMKRDCHRYPIDLGDEALSERTKAAARQLIAVLESYKLDTGRSRLIRQVRFRVAKPDWELD